MANKRKRMPLEQRAKIFMPFEPLSGFKDAIRKKEQELEAKSPSMDPLVKNRARKEEDDVP